jgi:hypothetical protein
MFDPKLRIFSTFTLWAAPSTFEDLQRPASLFLDAVQSTCSNSLSLTKTFCSEATFLTK